MEKKNTLETMLDNLDKSCEEMFKNNQLEKAIASLEESVQSSSKKATDMRKRKRNSQNLVSYFMTGRKNVNPRQKKRPNLSEY